MGPLLTPIVFRVGWNSRFTLLDLVEVASVRVERVIGFFRGTSRSVISVPQLLAPQQGNAKLACLSVRSYQQSPPSSDHH